MTDKSQIIVKIQNNSLMSSHGKKNLISVLDGLSDEDLGKLEELLDQEIEIILGVVEKEIAKGLKGDNSEKFVKDIKDLLRKTEGKILKVEEKKEAVEEEKKAEAILQNY